MRSSGLGAKNKSYPKIAKVKYALTTKKITISCHRLYLNSNFLIWSKTPMQTAVAKTLLIKEMGVKMNSHSERSEKMKTWAL